MSPRTPYLLFETNSGRYAVPADRVRQVVWLPVLAERTSDRRGHIGVAHIQEHEVDVLDLDLALGQTPAPYTLDHRLIDLDVDGDRIGLVAANVVDLVGLDDEELAPAPEGVEGLSARAHALDGLVEILDLDHLVSLPPSDEPEETTAEELFAEFSEAELDELAERQRRLTVAVGPGPGEHEEPVVLAEIGPTTVGLPLREVREFARVDELVPVPGTPDPVRGLTNHRGEIVTVVDVRGLLDPDAPRGTRPELAALVQLAGGLAGIAVDAVSRTVTLAEDELEPETDPAPGVRGSILREGRSIPVVQLSQLLGSEQVLAGQRRVRP